MVNWKINVLNLGNIEVDKSGITVGVDVGLRIVLPYLGFILDDGKQKIMVDTGISEKFIIDGKAWGGNPAKGGSDYVKKSLEKIGISIKDIHMVLYTHLHNDHVGSCGLFKDAKHVFQIDEWENLLDPLPSQKVRKDYDPEAIQELLKLDTLKIKGNLEILPGIKLLLTPGHTKGSMSIQVNTSNGVYIITGDTVIIKHNINPNMSSMKLSNGQKIKITPAGDVHGPAIPSSLVYDHYAWYQSIYNIKALMKNDDYILPGHEPSIVDKQFPA